MASNQIKLTPSDSELAELKRRFPGQKLGTVCMRLVSEWMATQEPLPEDDPEPVWRQAIALWREVTGYTGRMHTPIIMSCINRQLAEGMPPEDVLGVVRVAPRHEFVAAKMKSGQVKGYFPLNQLFSDGMLAMLIPMLDDVEPETGEKFDLDDYREILLEDIEKNYDTGRGGDGLVFINAAYEATNKDAVDQVRARAALTNEKEGQDADS